jgi:hypothetical protein
LSTADGVLRIREIGTFKELSSLASCLIEVASPFATDAAVAQIAAVLKSYRCTRVNGDKYAAEWVVQSFARHGVRYEHSEHDRSALYANMLPLLTSGRARLLDNRRLVHQLAGLERTLLPAGRERIDHVRGAHDDLSNACAGALTFASAHQPLRVSDACWRHVQAMAMQRRLQHLYGRV